MKLKYFFPLIIFLITVYVITIFKIPHNVFIMTLLSVLLSGYSLVYFLGIKGTVINKDIVIKIKYYTPIVAPYLFFTFFMIIMTVIIMPKKINYLIHFFLCFVLSLLFYIIGIFFLVKDLKKKLTININKSNKNYKKKLILINPVNQKKTGFTTHIMATFPPIGLGIIAALTPSDFQVKLIDENFEKFEYEDASLVGITAFTSNAKRAYEISSYYKKKNIPVVMGGIHASMLPDEALNYVDTVVIGEAEKVWGKIINDFLNGNLKKIYKGTHADLKNAVVPKREIFSSKYVFATIQTSRGCPMDCNFCSVSSFNGRTYRQRPFQEVLDELEEIPQNRIFFIDDNIIGYGEKSEKRAIELFKGMAERKLNKTWFCQATLNFGNNDELLKWAAKSGCKMVFLGLESSNHEELKGMNKKLNIKLEYDKAFKNINKYGIAVLGAFIYGSAYETEDSMLKKTDYILKNSIDVVQTTTLTPLPGTRVFKEMQENKKLIFNNFPDDWSRYDMTELTYILQNMTNEEFKKIMVICIKKIFSRWSLLKCYFKTLIHTRNIETAVWAYNSNAVYRSILFKK